MFTYLDNNFDAFLLLGAVLDDLENGKMSVLDLAQLGETVGAGALLATSGDVGIGQLLDNLQPLFGSSVLQHGLHDAGGIVLHRHLGKLAAQQFHQLVGHLPRFLLGVGLETELVPDFLGSNDGVGVAAVRLALVLQSALLVGGRLTRVVASSSRCIVAAIELALGATFAAIGGKHFLGGRHRWHIFFRVPCVEQVEGWTSAPFSNDYSSWQTDCLRA